MQQIVNSKLDGMLKLARVFWEVASFEVAENPFARFRMATFVVTYFQALALIAVEILFCRAPNYGAL